MISFPTGDLSLEQEAIVRAADFEIDTLDPEELKVCLKLAIRNDLIKTNIIHQLTQPVVLPKRRLRLAKKVCKLNCQD